MVKIHKGYCPGCPYNIGDPLTENGFNWGCLPGPGEIQYIAETEGTAWACHTNPHEMCFGFASENKDKHGWPLAHRHNVHFI